MTVLSGDTLRDIRPVEPFCERTVVNGMSYGVSYAGYDVRIREEVVLFPGEFRLASTVEYFTTPNYVVGIVHDKSTWARKGIAVQNTVIEPGWEGYLTLELTNHGRETIRIRSGDPICQILYHQLDKPVVGYEGKYQHQEARPVEAIFEND
jgi:dCTP deaminase